MVLPPIVFGSVDSRCFASVFPLSNASDLPRDFELAEDLARFSFGVSPAVRDSTSATASPADCDSFVPMPSGDSGAWREASDYPAVESSIRRVRALSVARLDRFHYQRANEQVPVQHGKKVRHRRTDAQIDHYVGTGELLFAGLARSAGGGPRSEVSLRRSRCAWSPRTILTRIFSRTRVSSSQVLDGRPPHRNAGDYLAITSRRLLWITERNRGCYEPHGSILRFAPLKNLTDIFVHCSGRNSGFFCRLKGGTLWYIPLESQGIDQGYWFADQAHQIIRPGFAKHSD
jgi:hypothetical protein